MTREEAIDRLMWLKDVPHINDDKWIEAIDMAIEALQGDMYCPNCGARLVPEGEYLEPTHTHGRLIDADALSKKLCEKTIFIKDGEAFQRMINDAPTVQADRPHGIGYVGVKDDYPVSVKEVLNITAETGALETQRRIKELKPIDRPHGEWIFRTDIPIGGGRVSAGYVCSNCRKDYFRVDGMNFCPNCGCVMVNGGGENE